MNEVRVNRKAAGRVASGHPWIFASDIADLDGAQPGAAVKVADPRGRLLGTAHYSSSSQIALRMLSNQVEEIGPEFYLKRISAAWRHRESILPPEPLPRSPEREYGRGSDLSRDREGAGFDQRSTAYRVVHGEADFLPALVVDRYADSLVVQTLNQGMDAARAPIVAALEEIFHPRGIVARNDVAVRAKEQLPLETTILAGEIPESVEVRINGLTMRADLLHGQKTGIFLDQRENYPAAAHYTRGGKALDCFTSTGGFALHLAAKCESVEAVDSGAAALATARVNAAANGIGNIHFLEADVFDLLAGHAAAHRQYSLVVLDPPAFAKSRRNLDAAAAGYKEINLRALRLLGPGGILVSCSCSHHVSEAMLLEVVAQASLDAGRTLRVLERRTQSQDHPILLTVPETHYLKCLILEVV